MTKEVFNECKLIGVKVVELIRPMYQLRQVRKIYDSAENVVGKHIQQVHLDTVKIQNEGNKKFELAIKKNLLNSDQIFALINVANIKSKLLDDKLVISQENFQDFLIG